MRPNKSVIPAESLSGNPKELGFLFTGNTGFLPKTRRNDKTVIGDETKQHTQNKMERKKGQTGSEMPKG